LPQNDKTRKRIVIDRVIDKRLDEFCEAERINKSDVLHLALADFLEKYEK
jgi:predicted transcriptional regulator